MSEVNKNEKAPLLEGMSQDQRKVIEENKIAKGKIYGLLLKTTGAKVAIIPSIILGLPILAMFILSGKIINVLYEGLSNPSNNDTMHQILVYSMIMVGVSVFIGFCKFIDSYYWLQCGAELSINMRKNLFIKLMQSEVSFFDRNPIGDLHTMLSEDAQRIQDSFGPIKGVQISNVTTLIGGVIGTLVYSWKIGLVFIASFVLIGIIFALFIPCVGKSMGMKFFFLKNEMTIANEAISSIKTVRSFNREGLMAEKFHMMNMFSQINERNALLKIAILMTIVMILVWGTIIGNLYFASYLFSNNKDGIGIGDLFVIFGFCMNASMSLISLTSTSDNEEKAIESGARIIKLSEYEPQIPFESGNVINDFKGNIEFKEVSFKYPTRNSFALKRVSFVIKPQQIAAFVGHSGSGKSTCIQLIERFYDVTEGSIYLDGVDIRTLDPHWIHKQIGLVSQDPVLFNTSIKDNILYGNKDADFNQVIEASEISNARKFIENFDNGFDTIVGERGSMISGGQKQRIAIARAVICNPVVLIADEATSSLDSENEKKIQIAFQKVMKNRTSIIVAHRLSTIKNSDIIYVFVAGEIKEKGNHEQLLQMKGFYYNLFNKQLKNRDNPNDPMNHVEKDETQNDTDMSISSTDQ